MLVIEEDGPSVNTGLGMLVGEEQPTGARGHRRRERAPCMEGRPISESKRPRRKESSRGWRESTNVDDQDSRDVLIAQRELTNVDDPNSSEAQITEEDMHNQPLKDLESSIYQNKSHVHGHQYADWIKDTQANPRISFSKLNEYDNKSNAQEHVFVFEAQIDLITQSEGLICKAFTTTLTRAIRWFVNLERNSISSWRGYRQMFLDDFSWVGSIPNDSSIPYLDSPYVDWIRETLPNPELDFSNLNKYYWNSNALEHLMVFQAEVGVITQNEALICKAFAATLRGPAINWFGRLQKNSIASWGEFRQKFLTKFRQTRANRTDWFCPYVDWIENTPLNANPEFSKLEKYYGDSCAWEHVMRFEIMVSIYTQNEALKCKAFATTLRGQAISWFGRLPRSSIGSWKEFKLRFFIEFSRAG